MSHNTGLSGFHFELTQLDQDRILFIFASCFHHEPRVNTFLLIFKTLPEDFKSGRMDFFQGSSPPNFIPFRLENVLEEDVLTPDPTIVRTPGDPTTQAPRTSESGLQVSPQSVDSETDVNVFAEKMVRIMEKVQSPIQEETIVANPADEQPFKNYESGENSSAPDIRNRTSTPEPKPQTRQRDASFTSIEANLEIAPISRTQLTELLLVQSNEGDESRGQRRPSEEDTSSHT